MADFDYTTQETGFDEFSPWATGSGGNLPPSPAQSPQLAVPALPVPLTDPSVPAGYKFNPDSPAPVIDTRGSVAFDPKTIPMPAPLPADGGAAGFGQDDTPAENAHTLGLALLLVGAGSALGVRYGGGVYGGTAGAIYGGSAMNGIRAIRSIVQGNADSDKEAMISATYAVAGAALATWLLFKSEKRKQGAK